MNKFSKLLIAFLFLPVLGFSQVTGESKSFKFSVAHAPKVEWEAPDKDTVKSNNAIMPIKATITSKLPIKSVELFLNDLISERYTVTSKYTEVINERELTRYKIDIDKMIDLRPGINTLRVVAIDEKNNKKEDSKFIAASISNNTILTDKTDGVGPSFYVSNPPNLKQQNDFVRYSQDMIKISGTVIDDSGVKSLKINGITTPIRSNGNYIINLPLVMGENAITMEAADINGNISIKKFTVLRRDLTGGEYVASSAKNFLIVIGINDYSDWPKLNNAVRDAQDVADILQTQYRFEPQNVTLLTDSLATRENIYQTLREHVTKVGPQDNLMIYYSGHGYFDELLNEGYWVPVDAGKKSVSGFLQNAILLNVLKNINSQHTFLVADACFSGSLFSASSRGFIDNVEKYKSRWGLASGRLETVSDGDLGQNSPFAQNFIKYLRENDKDRFPVSELVQYVKVQVSEVSDQTPVGNPLKGAGDEGGEFIFYKK